MERLLGLQRGFLELNAAELAASGDWLYVLVPQRASVAFLDELDVLTRESIQEVLFESDWRLSSQVCFVHRDLVG